MNETLRAIALGLAGLVGALGAHGRRVRDRGSADRAARRRADLHDDDAVPKPARR